MLKRIFFYQKRRTTPLDEDIQQELVSNLEMTTQELMEAGESSENARQIARQRFGDPDRYQRQVRKIDREDSIMLSRINAALLVVVLVMLVGGWMQLKQNDAHIARTLGEISERMEVLAAPKPTMVTESQATQTPGVVYLDGDVPRPGVYNIPEDRTLTLRLLLTASGIKNTSMDDSISVMLHSGNHTPSYVSGKELSDPAFDAVLLANDLVMVWVGASS